MFCAGSNPACCLSEIRNGKDLWQWSRLEIRLNTFRWSTMPQKQFIIIIIITMINVFHFYTYIPYNLRSRSELYSRNPKTVKYGTETTSYLAPKIWSLVPNAIKSSKSLDVFKSKIRQWKPDCPCRSCKNYLQHVGFI